MRGPGAEAEKIAAETATATARDVEENADTAVVEETDVINGIDGVDDASGVDGINGEAVKTKRKRRTLYQRFLSAPIGARLVFLLFFAAIPLHFLFALFPAFADGFNGTVGAALRRLLAALTDLLPFSFAETLILLLPFVLIGVVVLAFFVKEETVSRIIASLLAAICGIYVLFVGTFAAGYQGVGLDKKMGMEDTGATAAELYATAEWLLEETESSLEEVGFLSSGSSHMPYSFASMTERLNDAYGTLCDRYSFVQDMRTSPKPVNFSEVMSEFHILGIYTFFTGEANVNVSFPDYTTVYTTAHEMAHQRGIARENEANFVAFLACISSDDGYIRYCGYMSMLEYVMTALYRADADSYRQFAQRLPAELVGEMRAYDAVYAKYADSAAAVIGGAVNDAFLQSQGTPGRASYGLVVNLAVAYCREVTQGSAPAYTD